MEIDRNVEFLSSSKKRPIGFIVIETALVVIVYEGADKAQLLDAANQFVGRGYWIRYRDRRPATKAGRMLCYCCSQTVVGILALRQVDDSVSNRDDSGECDVVRKISRGFKCTSRSSVRTQSKRASCWDFASFHGYSHCLVTWPSSISSSRRVSRSSSF